MKKVYKTPSVETLDCKVERGFAGSGEPTSSTFDGSQLEGLSSGGDGTNNLFN